MAGRVGLISLIAAGVLSLCGSGNGAMEVSRHIQPVLSSLESLETSTLRGVLESFSSDIFQKNDEGIIRRSHGDTLFYRASKSFPYHSMRGYDTLSAVLYYLGTGERENIGASEYVVDNLMLISNPLGPLFFDLSIKGEDRGFLVRFNVLGEDMAEYVIDSQKVVDCWGFKLTDNSIVQGSGSLINCPR